LRAYLKQGLFVSSRVTATVKHAERAARLAKELDVSVTNDNRGAVKSADIILLAVKPQTVAEVLQEIAPEIGAETLLISVAASVPTSYLEQQLAAASGGKHNEVAVAKHTRSGRLRDDGNLPRYSCGTGPSRNCSQDV
jgi:pyrroline-5-carboxylate reductase